jgi:hypothetical protein
MTAQSNSSRAVSPLYSRFLSSEEKHSIRHVPSDDISSEINLLRKLAVLFMKFQQSAPDDLASCMQALLTSTILCEQLAILARYYAVSQGNVSDIEDLLLEALDGLPLFELPEKIESES